MIGAVQENPVTPTKRMKHRCQDWGGIVKEVTACGDQKRGSQLLWGKG